MNRERADPREGSARNVKTPGKGSDASRVRDAAPDVLSCARWLQSVHGLYVFAVDHPGLMRCAGAHRPDQPCDGKRGKHPCGKWSRDATNDPQVVAVALSRGLRNIGIACKPSGLLVIDEDQPGAFEDYAASIGQTLAPTFTVTTAKGQHFYYRPPADVPLGNGRGALADRGIDVRGGGASRGGFVVGPGSVHETGVLYAPVDSAAPILPVPGWLASALQAPATRPALPRTARPAVRTSSGGRPFKVLTGLVQVVLDAMPERDRNSRLYWAACRMYEHVDKGLFEAEAGRGALLEAARPVGLADGEAERTHDSARSMTGGNR
jgi:hypothetical protein